MNRGMEFFTGVPYMMKISKSYSTVRPLRESRDESEFLMAVSAQAKWSTRMKLCPEVLYIM